MDRPEFDQQIERYETALRLIRANDLFHTLAYSGRTQPHDSSALSDAFRRWEAVK